MSKKKFIGVAAVIAVCIMGLMANSKSKPPLAQETISARPPPHMLAVSHGYDRHCVRPGWGDPLVHAFPEVGWGITQQQIDRANEIGDWMAKDPDFCEMAEAAIDHSIKAGRWLQMGEYPGQ